MAIKLIPDRPISKPLPKTMAEAEPYEVYEVRNGLLVWKDLNGTIICSDTEVSSEDYGFLHGDQEEGMKAVPTLHLGRIAGIVVDDGEVSHV